MLGRQAQQAAQWRASLPQATAAVKGMPANYVMESPEGQARHPYIPAVPVDASTRLKHTLEGMRNPMTAKEAVTWNTGMAEETKREDTQQAARENLAATLQQRMFDAKLRSQDVNATLAQKAEYQKEYLRLQDEWRKLASDDKRYMADALGGRATTTAADKAQERKDIRIEKQVEHLAAAAKTLAPMLQSAQTVQNMLDDYGKKPIPGIGYEAKLPGIMLPAEGVNNKAKIKAFANAMLRAQAGLSQTLSETENANLELLANGNYSEKEFRQIWPTLMDKINASATTTTSGFEPEAVETVRKRGGVIDPIKPRAAKTAPAKPAAAPTVAPTAAPGASNPDGSSVNPRDDQIRIIQAERDKATNPQDIIALDRELARLGVKPKSALPAATAAAAGGLTPVEAAELAALKKRLGK